MLDRGLLSRILFPIPTPTYTADDFPEELIWIPLRPFSSTDGDAIQAPSLEEECNPCLMLPHASARFIIIYFHSNAEDLGMCRPFCLFLRDQFQVHVMAVEYPGYGICSGIPSDETVLDNAMAAMRFATDSLRWPLDSIKVMGRSIGTGPAVSLAAKFSLGGLILIAPFLSVREIFRDRIGLLADLVKDAFCSQEAAPKIKCPTLIVHGQRDSTIAPHHGQQLYQLLKSRKFLVMPPDMEHNSNLLNNLQYFILPMFHFFSLPDYIFQDIEIPLWAFDKRRCKRPHTTPLVSSCMAGPVPSRSSEAASQIVETKVSREKEALISSIWERKPPSASPLLDLEVEKRLQSNDSDSGNQKQEAQAPNACKISRLISKGGLPADAFSDEVCVLNDSLVAAWPGPVNDLQLAQHERPLDGCDSYWCCSETQEKDGRYRVDKSLRDPASGVLNAQPGRGTSTGFQGLKRRWLRLASDDDIRTHVCCLTSATTAVLVPPPTRTRLPAEFEQYKSEGTQVPRITTASPLFRRRGTSVAISI